jgi:hypothetical protein
MWAKVAEEMQVPWRAAEAIHWQIGEAEMARRAGVVPFALSSTESSHPQSHRSSPARGHAHSQSQGSLPRDLSAFSSIPSPHYGRGIGGFGPGPGYPALSIPPPPSSSSRMLAARRESVPPRGPFDHPPHPYPAALGQHPPEFVPYGPGPGLAPIQTTGGQGRGGSQGGPLPSVAELTTGVSPYSTPAYSSIPAGTAQAQQPGPVGMPPGVPGASPIHSGTTSPGAGPLMPPYPSLEPLPTMGGPGPVAKRRASPEIGVGPREASRRRQMDPAQEEEGAAGGSSSGGPGPGPGPGEYRGGGGQGPSLRRSQ